LVWGRPDPSVVLADFVSGYGRVYLAKQNIVRKEPAPVAAIAVAR
jgi:hypothetical protein